MNDRREIEKRLGKFSIPPPGDLVRTRALAAGREASGRHAVRDVWERIWSSTPFRVAWTTAVILLVAGHLSLPRAPRRTVSTPRYAERMLGAEADAGLVASLIPPPVDGTALEQWGGLENDNQDKEEEDGDK